MACSYSLKIGNQVRQYDNYQDLFQDLIDNKIKIETGKADDIVFSQNDSRQSETVALLERIKSDKQITNGTYDGNSGELKEVAANGYVSVTDYVEKATKLDGSVFVTPYNEKQLKTELHKYLVQQGMSQAEAAKQVESDLQEFKQVAEVASNLHAVARAYFGGSKTKDALYNIFNANFNIENIEKIVQGLQGIESYLKQRHGDNVQILSGLTISSKIVGENDKLLGTLDIVAVDETGRAHLYQIKGSSKQYGLMLDVRLRKTDYQLAFYRHMLAAQGISVRDMSLNTIPVRILLENGEVNNLIFQDIEDRTAITSRDGINRLQWGTGEFYTNVNQKIDVQLSQPSTVTSKVTKQTLDTLEKFFPGRRIQTLRWDKTREQFIKKYVRDSLDPSQGRWEFRDIFNNTTVYIKEDSPKESNSELVEKVDKYLNKSRNASIDYMQNMYNKMKDVLNGTSPIEVLTDQRKAGARSSFLVANIGQYINGDWSLVENESLMQLGIIALKNDVTKQVDFISISSNQGDINGEFKIGLGDTILGCHKKNYDIQGNRLLLKATNGNIELMKVMAALNSMPNWFNGIFKVGNIKVINPQTGLGTNACTKQITTSFNMLCREAGVKNNMDQVEFVDQLELFNQVLIAATKSSVLDSDLTNNIFADLERINVQNSTQVLKVLNDAAARMEMLYPSLLGDSRIYESAVKSNRPETAVYDMLIRTINLYSGNPFYQPRNFSSAFGSFKKGDFIGGLNAANPSTQRDPNLQRMHEIASNAFTLIAEETSSKFREFQSKDVRKLWEAKGYSWTQNTLIGNQASLYSNMLERNPDGTLNQMIIFKNPYDSNSKLMPEERAFLKSLLWKINKLRFKLENELESSQKVQDLKKQKSWYWVPLAEATQASKVQQTKPADFVQKEKTNIQNILSRWFKRKENDVYTEQEEEENRIYMERNEAFNRFSLSESSESDRMDLLAKYSSDFWEQNMDTLYAKYLWAHIRKKHLDKALPLIKNIKLMAIAYGQQTGKDMTTYTKYIDDYIKSNIHNQALLDEEAVGMMSYLRPIKYLASTMALGFNITTGVRNTLESLWKVPSKIMGKFFGGKEVFTFNDWMQAVGILIGDTADFMHNITLVEELNRVFRMQNMDSNRIAQEIMTNKSGLLNAFDRLQFWTSTAPDYFNRMSMLIAQMIHDGCWEALEVTDTGIKYNWKKDKRFDAYAVDDKSDMKKYNEQRSLYFFLLDESNKERGLNLKEGDELPLPYTNAQIGTLKTFSDTTFGFYDHESRAMLQKTAIGSLFSQFRTFVTAQRTNWLLSPDYYATKEVVHLTDEKTGEPLYWKIVTEEDGTEIRVPTTENTGIAIYGPKYSYMEGIAYTLSEAFDEWKSHGFKSAWDEIRSVDTKWNNMKLFVYNMIVGLLLAYALAAIIKMWGNSRKEKAGPKTISSVIGDQLFDTFGRSLTGSVQDFNIIQTFKQTTLDTEPAAFGILNNMFTSTGQTLFGNRTLQSWMRSNIGAYRSTYEFFNGLGELGQGVEGSVNQLT